MERWPAPFEHVPPPSPGHDGAKLAKPPRAPPRRQHKRHPGAYPATAGRGGAFGELCTASEPPGSGALQNERQRCGGAGAGWMGSGARGAGSGAAAGRTGSGARPPRAAPGRPGPPRAAVGRHRSPAPAPWSGEPGRFVAQGRAGEVFLDVLAPDPVGRTKQIDGVGAPRRMSLPGPCLPIGPCSPTLPRSANSRSRPEAAAPRHIRGDPRAGSVRAERPSAGHRCPVLSLMVALRGEVRAPGKR